MRTFIENYLHFIKNCIRPPYKKLKPLKSGFIEKPNFENNRDPCDVHQDPTNLIRKDYSAHLQLYNIKAKPPVPAMPPPTKMHEEAPLLWTHLVATHIVE